MEGDRSLKMTGADCARRGPAVTPSGEMPSVVTVTVAQPFDWSVYATMEVSVHDEMAKNA